MGLAVQRMSRNQFEPVCKGRTYLVVVEKIITALKPKKNKKCKECGVKCLTSGRLMNQTLEI